MQEAIIGTQKTGPATAEGTAEALLQAGESVATAAEQSGLPIAAVEEIAAKVLSPDVKRLAEYVNARLRALGMSQLEASKLGLVSRSTLNLLGKDSRVPNDVTLAKFDELLEWEPGSARAVMFRSEPSPRERERAGEPRRPKADSNAKDDFANLHYWIDRRLRELNMSRSRLAAVGGPGRTTLSTLGSRGYQPTPDTLERLDTHLLWEPGSAYAALKGGEPIKQEVLVTMHPALVPLAAIKDRLKVIRSKAQRQAQTIEEMIREVDDAMAHVDLAVGDLGRSPQGFNAQAAKPGTDTVNADVAVQEESE
ncbi:hypothetical protein [[Mycobacterium] nativiensis]|uniref:HTH cro/C1-type domain-containing protein n=1 Tax=[Mycobacterium] nativiensis TaxID=2855503 RepID=A0ABU5XUS4_9MYCO|nr:hypothetical protein [Mycolicibacter sp. MYC340]MEB3031744.1 hypothetical protein [Mycolicibacter sp. MYC340]